MLLLGSLARGQEAGADVYALIVLVQGLLLLRQQVILLLKRQVGQLLGHSPLAEEVLVSAQRARDHPHPLSHVFATPAWASPWQAHVVHVASRYPFLEGQKEEWNCYTRKRARVPLLNCPATLLPALAFPVPRDTAQRRSPQGEEDAAFVTGTRRSRRRSSRYRSSFGRSLQGSGWCLLSAVDLRRVVAPQ